MGLYLRTSEALHWMLSGGVAVLGLPSKAAIGDFWSGDAADGLASFDSM